MNDGPILLAINDLGFGGGQRTVIEEARELTRRGIDVYVLTTLKHGGTHLKGTLSLPESRFVHIPFSSIADVPSYIHLLRFLRARRPKVVVSNLFFTNTIVRVAKLLYPSVRVVVREGNVTREKGLFATTVDFLLSAVTHRIIANSTIVAESLKTSAFFSRVSVIYNGIDEKYYSVVRDATRVAQFDIPPGTPVFLSVGSLVKKKGREDLLRARALMKRDCVLLIAGDGPERGKLEALSQKLGFENSVHFLGARTDMEALYSAADVFVLSSHWEGMPNAMLEAMAAGLPVVMTDVGGVREILKDGTGGYCVPAGNPQVLADTMDILAENANLRNTMGREARESVEPFRWKRHVDELLSIL